MPDRSALSKILAEASRVNVSMINLSDVRGATPALRNLHLRGVNQRNEAVADALARIVQLASSAIA